VTTARVWLPGGKGMLGRAAARVLGGLGHEVLVTDLELPVDNPEAVADYVATAQPTHVLNCAAYTAVDKAESEPAAAERGNVGIPAALSAHCPLPVAHISTDYVFDGSASSPYVEDAETSPQSVYGSTKLDGERAFWAGAGDAPRYVVRTSWLFGREGNNFVSTMLRLMGEREELRVVADQYGRPTYADDLARAAAGLLGLADNAPAATGTYHFANAGETTWHGFAAAIREHALALGFPLACERVLPITTADYPTPAARPAYSVLDTHRIESALGVRCPPWTEALDEVIQARDKE